MSDRKRKRQMLKRKKRLRVSKAILDTIEITQKIEKEKQADLLKLDTDMFVEIGYGYVC